MFLNSTSRATFTCKRTPRDNEIDWSAPAERVRNLVRGVTYPYSGATTTLDGNSLTIWSVQRLPEYSRYVGRIPGGVVDVLPGRGSVVLTGDEAVLVTEVSTVDGERRPADLVLNRRSQDAWPRLAIVRRGP